MSSWNARGSHPRRRILAEASAFVSELPEHLYISQAKSFSFSLQSVSAKPSSAVSLSCEVAHLFILQLCSPSLKQLMLLIASHRFLSIRVFGFH